MSLSVQNKVKELTKQRLESTLESPERRHSSGSGSRPTRQPKDDSDSESTTSASEEAARDLNAALEERQQNLIYRTAWKIVDSRLCCGNHHIHLFKRLIDLTILANTVTFALDRHPGDPELDEGLEKVNIVFYAIFCIEMILKVLALGPEQYVKTTRFNIFDAFIVLVSTVDIIIQYALEDASLGAVSALRAFRLLRIFKLAQSWKQFQNLLIIIGKTLQDVSNFSILLFLLMFIYTLLGMEMFAHKVAFDQEDQPTLPQVDDRG